MSDGLLLSKLCAICHSQPRKYTCPRCGLQSCSLSCVKRHKLRSQCSGVRDPARYYKRTELSTPRAFDEDFNFISCVERSVEMADREIDRLGVSIPYDGRLQKAEARLLAEIERSGAIVRRAPKGMSRSRQNLTRWEKKKKCLFWTVEWVLTESRSTTTVSENESIQNSYHKLLRRPKSGVLGKRKCEQPLNINERKNNESEKGESGETCADGSAVHLSRSEPIDKRDSTFFYLHRPLAATKAKALIKLDPDVVLATAIRGRVLLEYPTIYVLPNPPDELPAGYIAHADGMEVNRPDQNVPFSLQKNVAEHCESTLSIDPVKIAEVIQKDLVN